MAFKKKSAILKSQARKALSLRDVRWGPNTKVDKYRITLFTCSDLIPFCMTLNMFLKSNQVELSSGQTHLFRLFCSDTNKYR